MVRTRPFIALLLLLIPFLSLLPVHAADVPPAARILRNLDDSRPIGWFLDVLRDPTGLLTVDDVQKDTIANGFQPVLRDTPVFGETDDAIWLRLRLDSRQNLVKAPVLSLSRPMTDRIDVYFDDGNGYFPQSDGLLVDKGLKNSFKSYVFEIPANIGPDKPVYIRVQDTGLITLPFVAHSLRHLISAENSSSVLLGFAIGIMALLTIGNFASYARTKTPAVLALSIFTVCLLIFISVYSGFLKSQIDRIFLDGMTTVSAVCLLLAPLALSLFQTGFYQLDTTVTTTRFWLILIGLMGFATLIAHATGQNFQGSGTVLTIALSFGFNAYAFTLVYTNSKKEDVPPGSLFVLLGCSLLLPGVLTYLALDAFFDVPPYVSQLGYVIMTVATMCLSFGLDRQLRATEKAERAALQSAAGRLQAVFESANDALFVLDSKGQVVEANQIAEELIDSKLDSILGRPVIDLIIPPNLRMGHRQALKRYIHSGDGYFRDSKTETRGQNVHGETFPVIISMSTVIIDRQPYFAMRVSQGTDLNQMEVPPNIQSRYDLAFRATGDALTDWDAQTETVYVSNSYEHIFGLSGEQGLKSPTFIVWDDVIHPEDREEVLRLESDIRRGKLGRADITYRIYHGTDTSLRWIKTSIAAETDSTGRILRVATVNRDITERQMRESQLSQEAFHDALTGLSNRARLIDHLKHLISRHNQGLESKGVVMIINIDRFQQINDNLGHSAGDEFLVLVARRIEKFTGTDKTLARLEGDTFALLIEGEDDVGAAQTYARELQLDITRPVFLQGQEIFPSVSIGIAQLGYRHNRAEEALSDAHRALSQGREQSAGRIKVFGLNTKASSDGRLALEAALHHALSREELVLHYQPIVDLETNQLAGFEALMRWNHVQQGLISPGKFIPISEETGLIIDMGAWALKEACNQVARWQAAYPDQPPFFISINISARQFVDHDLVQDVKAALDESQIDPGLVKLEITEGLIMENPEFAAVILQKFKELGVKLSIDDFGTGYSSLSYLHRFPFDVLKIDRSFVMTMLEKEQSEVIIRSIASLAHNLQMEIVAEGAEKLAQIDKLHELGCEYVQGFYYGRPLESKTAELWFVDPEAAMENPPRQRA